MNASSNVELDEASNISFEDVLLPIFSTASNNPIDGDESVSDPLLNTQNTMSNETLPESEVVNAGTNAVVRAPKPSALESMHDTSSPVIHQSSENEVENDSVETNETANSSNAENSTSVADCTDIEDTSLSAVCGDVTENPLLHANNLIESNVSPIQTTDPQAVAGSSNQNDTAPVKTEFLLVGSFSSHIIELDEILDETDNQVDTVIEKYDEDVTLIFNKATGFG